MIKEYQGISPEIHKDAFIAETAVLIGDVKVEKDSSIWYGAVLRGDESPIVIREGTSIQDNCVLHCDRNSPMDIGRNCTVGHGAMIHGSIIGDNVLVGMGAIILNGAKIGDNCVIAAGTVVKENAEIPANSMLVGVPGKIIRTLNEKQIAERQKTSYYVELAKHYLQENGENDTI